MEHIGTRYASTRRRLLFGATAVFGAMVLGAASCQPPPPPPDQLEYSLLSLGAGDTTGADQLGNSHAFEAAISGDGEWTAFTTGSSNVTTNDPGPGLFLRNNSTATVERVSDSGYSIGVSDDGRWVTWVRNGEFHGRIVHVYDRTTGTTHAHGNQYGSSMVPVVDGGAEPTVVYGTSTPEGKFCWTWNLVTGAHGSCATQPSDPARAGDPLVSPNGRFVVQENGEGTAGDTTLLWDRELGTVTDLGDLPFYGAAIDDDATTITGLDLAAPSGPGAAQYDIASGSVRSAPNRLSEMSIAGVSRDGRHVQFIDLSDAPHAVSMWDTTTGAVTSHGTVESPATGATVACGSGLVHHVTYEGEGCLRTTEALVPSDTNGFDDAYLVG